MRKGQQEDQKTKFAHYRALDLTNKIYQVKALRLAKDLNLKSGSLILDLGCADGSFIAKAGEILNAIPYGLDLDKATIDEAIGLGVKAVSHDLSQVLPYKDKTFDLIFALEVIEHLFDTDFFVEEIYRVLKPGGYLILSTPNLASLNNRLRLLLGSYPKYLEFSQSGAGHIHLYTLPVLIGQLKQANFKIKTATSPNFLCPLITKSYFPKPLRDFCMFIGDLFPRLGSHLLIVAEK